MPIASHTWQVQTGGTAVNVALDTPLSETEAPLLVFAHGAGGHMGDRSMLALSSVFVEIGCRVVRFNFPYREKGSARPDRMPVLQECIDRVVQNVRTALSPRRLVIGGRSMGGRAASMLAARGYSCDGLLLLAYPLHPAGQPEKLRDDHLAAITVPVLCLNGTRDALCRRDLMERVTAGLGAQWGMHWIEHADHSFHVTRSSGRTDAEVLAEIGRATRQWIEERILAAAPG